MHTSKVIAVRVWSVSRRVLVGKCVASPSALVPAGVVVDAITVQWSLLLAAYVVVYTRSVERQSVAKSLIIKY